MNIKEAKEQIIYTVQTYLTRNRQGQYAIPLPRQRPLCLMGPPGIGKTAIVEQVAQELGIGLVAYSMTHHTRQSAIGLPVILEKSYGGKACRVSEYTMSEIIASVYDMMEETGRKEGILFLDEINCVSETLAPSMLQFLQYKVFGRHPIPQGWVVVTAGNPPEYNHSARDFDMVTWDRLRRIDVEPDFRVWKEYGRQQGLHPAIMTYLETRWNDFYRVEATVEGKRFVTPRGWADLSESIVLYEQRGLPVDAALVAQYLQDPQTAQTFALYYDLFCKYQSHYQVEKILEGKAPADIRQRAAEAPFDERLALIGLLLDGVFASLREQAARERLPPLLLGQADRRSGGGPCPSAGSPPGGAAAGAGAGAEGLRPDQAGRHRPAGPYPFAGAASCQGPGGGNPKRQKAAGGPPRPFGGAAPGDPAAGKAGGSAPGESIRLLRGGLPGGTGAAGSHHRADGKPRLCAVHRQVRLRALL